MAACVLCLGMKEEKKADNPSLKRVDARLQCLSCETSVRSLFAESSDLPGDLQRLLYLCCFDTVPTAVATFKAQPKPQSKKKPRSSSSSDDDDDDQDGDEDEVEESSEDEAEGILVG